MCSDPGGVVIAKGTLLTLASSPALAVSVYDVLVAAIERSLKVATPPTAATTVVPERAAGGGLPLSATVTLSPNPVARLPKVSCAATWTGGVIGASPIALL